MGCLNVRFKSVSGYQTEYTPLNGIDVRCERIGGVKVNFYFVCRVGTKEYIRVSPEEPIWITMDEMGVYTIRSNTNWQVL